MVAVTENLTLRMKSILEALRPLEEKEAAMKAQLKIIAADAAIELMPDHEELEGLRELYAKYEAEARQRALAGEDIVGVSLTTTKKVDINIAAAVQWAYSANQFSMLTLTSEAIKEIENAVKNRVFEVPPEVAQYREEKSTKIYKEKILNE